MAISEQNRVGDFLLSRANGNRSMDTVTVAAGQNLATGSVVGVITASGQIGAYNSAATDGLSTATGVLYGDCNATTAATQAVIVARDAEVLKAQLVWGAGAATPESKLAAYDDLAAAGIIVRN